MLSDVDAVLLCNDIYNPDFKSWDELWIGDGADGIYAGIKDNTLVFRGSITEGDWVRDFDAFPHQSLEHEQLGPVHAGFYEGMDVFFQKATKLLGPNPTICGHSLGAARAWLFAGLYIASGGMPAGIRVFGSPRPGCEQLRQIVSKAPCSSYKNRYDPVTSVPVWLPDFPVIDMAPFTLLNQSPVGDDLGIFADHHIELYCAGVERLAHAST